MLLLLMLGSGGTSGALDVAAFDVEHFGESSLRRILKVLAATLPDGMPLRVCLDKPRWLCCAGFSISLGVCQDLI